MNAPTDLLYTDQHEWIRVQGRTGTVGISDFAQNALGDVTFIDLPAVGTVLARGAEACAIESCKAASGIYAPVGGKVTEVNAALTDDPGLVNREPYGKGWLFKLAVADPSDLDRLMKAAQYQEFCAKEA
ncbi:MAG TPA: glycine cleavage system protein GcvH [Phycisphaerales bacterium]|nr:glycine cleavage system protein GcvH [Phycisphaerales bacterium]